MANSVKEAAAELRRQIEEKVQLVMEGPEMAEVLTLHRALNGLEDVLREPRTGLAEFFSLPPTTPTSVMPSAPSPSVRFDEFYGIPELQAAKLYLKKYPDARPFEEIVAAIRAGSGKVETEAKLHTGLSRSTLDVVKIGERYGHIDNYPEEKAKRLKRLRRSQADERRDEPS